MNREERFLPTGESRTVKAFRTEIKRNIKTQGIANLRSSLPSKTFKAEVGRFLSINGVMGCRDWKVNELED